MPLRLVLSRYELSQTKDLLSCTSFGCILHPILGQISLRLHSSSESRPNLRKSQAMLLVEASEQFSDRFVRQPEDTDPVGRSAWVSDFYTSSCGLELCYAQNETITVIHCHNNANAVVCNLNRADVQAGFDLTANSNELGQSNMTTAWNSCCRCLTDQVHYFR